MNVLLEYVNVEVTGYPATVEQIFYYVIEACQA